MNIAYDAESMRTRSLSIKIQPAFRLWMIKNWRDDEKIRNCFQALLDIKECPNLDRIFSGPALKPWKCCVFTVWCDLPWKAVGVRGSTADEEEEEACFCPVICMQKMHCIYFIFTIVWDNIADMNL